MLGQHVPERVHRSRSQEQGPQHEPSFIGGGEGLGKGIASSGGVTNDPLIFIIDRGGGRNSGVTHSLDRIQYAECITFTNDKSNDVKLISFP